MAERMEKKDFVKLIAHKMNADKETAEIWVNAVFDTMYDVFKDGKGLTLTGFGGFYLDRRRSGTVFKFNPGQKLKALFGWSSSFKGQI
ncbi:MAG: HU family DNA-binding protein [Desulfobacterales bacterium]